MGKHILWNNHWKADSNEHMKSAGQRAIKDRIILHRFVILNVFYYSTSSLSFLGNSCISRHFASVMYGMMFVKDCDSWRSYYTTVFL